MSVVYGEACRALRTLRHHPLTGIVGAVGLAAAVGVAVPMYLYLDQTVIRASSIPRPNEIFVARLVNAAGTDELLHPRHVAALSDGMAVGTNIAGFAAGGRSVPDEGVTADEIVWSTIESTGFRVLGVRPLLGRIYTTAEEKAGELTAVISYRLWRRAYGGDPSVLGRMIRSAAGPAYRIIGVMPRRFLFPRPSADVWIAIQPAAARAERLRFLSLLVRAPPGEEAGATRARLQSAVTSLLGSRGPRVNLEPIDEYLLASARRAAPLIASGAGAVLLLAIAVLALLLLDRVSQSRAELSMRVVLGSTKVRAFCVFPLQGVVIGLIGGSGGLVFAALLTEARGIAAVDEEGILLGAMDGLAIASALGASVLVGTVAGILVSVRQAHWAPWPPARAGCGTETRMSQGTATFALATSMAVAVAAVICAGLAWMSTVNLSAVSPGFDTVRLLTARVTLDRLRDLPVDRMHVATRDFERMLGGARRLPGVVSAAFTTSLPMHAGGFRLPFYAGEPREECDAAWLRGVSDGYFATLGLPVLDGRVFTGGGSRDVRRAAVVNRALARGCWPGRSPVGQNAGFPGEAWTVVGVVGDIPMFGLRHPPVPEVYLPMSGATSFTMVIVLRVAGEDPYQIAGPLRRLALSIDPEAKVSAVRSMEDVLANAEMPLAIRTTLLTAAAACAVLVALVGVSAITALSSHQQRRNRAIRVAVGATTVGLLYRAIGGALLRVLPGVFAGLVLARLAASSLARVLFRVDPFEPSIYGAVAAVLVLCVAMAAWVGGRDVLSTDVVRNLRD